MVRRNRALALLLLPLLALLSRSEPAPFSPRKALRPGTRAGARATDGSPPRIPSTVDTTEPSDQGPPPADAEPTVDASPEAPQDPDSWKRSHVASALVWLARHQNEDGSWGESGALLEGQFVGRAGITSHVLLALLGAGYSQLSKDVYDGTNMGDCVRRALKWMLKDQKADGGFESAVGVFDQALATLALSEGYGMTASGYLKDPARKGLDALIALQFPDGSWGPAPISAAAMQALASAELDELEFEAEVKARALQYAATSEHPGMLAGRLLLARQKASVDSPISLSLFQSRPASDDLACWLQASTAIYLSVGPEGLPWKEWREPMLQVTEVTRARDGSWPGGNGSSAILRTSLATQMLEILYRYSNVYGTAAK